MNSRPLSSLLLVLTLTAASLPAASAQSLNQHAIRDQLKHKVVLLRGRYLCAHPGGCTLRFNQQGQLQSKAPIGPLSLSAIYVDKLKLRRRALVLHAHEATILPISKASPIQLGALILSHQKVIIRIAIDASKPSELQSALRKIFVRNIQQFLNAEPPQQRQADLDTLPSLVPKSKAEAVSEPKEIGWPTRHVFEHLHRHAVTPPNPIYTITPRYTKKAKEHKVQGKCDLSLVVDAHGFPQNIRVVRSLPDGLDERALAAISQYRFRPATQNGKPVAVRLIVEVDFHLY